MERERTREKREAWWGKFRGEGEEGHQERAGRGNEGEKGTNDDAEKGEEGDEARGERKLKWVKEETKEKVEVKKEGIRGRWYMHRKRKRKNARKRE